MKKRKNVKPFFMYRIKRINIRLITVVRLMILTLTTIIVVNLLGILSNNAMIDSTVNLNHINSSAFRDLKISSNTIIQLKNLEHKSDIEYTKLLTLYMIINNYDLMEFNQKTIERYTKDELNKVLNSKIYSKLCDDYYKIFNDLNYFPVPMRNNGESYVTYEDSWNSSRSYGGNRVHEGTDIMASENTRGFIPIISITDGIVEKMGWLDQGGYRIGVRSPSGGYFYYAHLYSYAPNIKIGDKIKAGELLGFMGDSGYGKVEGTIGKFPVHLHIGIYIDDEGKEISINPYGVLKYLEKNKLNFNY